MRDPIRRREVARFHGGAALGRKSQFVGPFNEEALNDRESKDTSATTTTDTLLSVDEPSPRRTVRLTTLVPRGSRFAKA
jgi:hypothetical protein